MTAPRRGLGDSRSAGVTRSRSVLGIDLGGTKVAAAVVDERGHPHGMRRRFDRAWRGARPVVDDIVATAEEAIDSATVRPSVVGIGVAGQIDPVDGSVRYAPNLRWRDVPLGRLLARRLGARVVVVNDGRAATFGEATTGAARRVRDVLCVWTGTGIGGGIVSGGRLLDGASNAAGEIGHSTLVAGGRKCTCPRRGCLEAYVGGWAIAARAREAAARSPGASRTLVEIAGSVRRITAGTVSTAAARGDRFARGLDRETGRLLADGVVGLVNALNPRRVVLGGGLIDHHPEWVAVVDAAVRRRPQPPAARVVRAVGSRLGTDAVLIGAALWAGRQGTEPAERLAPNLRRMR
ncbi:MAG TPA: ROK family protein [Thermoplasmata archaeon]|nr:ROK family protein [Thermoplasmata archaeon]